MKIKRILKISAVIILTVLILIFILNIILKKFIYKTNYLNIICESTSDYLIDPYLILSIIKAESNFNENAISGKEAYGLMQILFSTASDVNNEIDVVENLDKNNICIPKNNITLGTKYLNNLIKRYNGNYYLAICAYNAGFGTVDKWITSDIISDNFNFNDINNIPYKETKYYLKNVINNYKMYKILY